MRWTLPRWNGWRRLGCLVAVAAAGCGRADSDPDLEERASSQPLPTSFGAAVAIPGDIDADGIQDMALGLPGKNAGGEDKGLVQLRFLNADATEKSRLEIRSGRAGFTGRLRERDRFGWALAALGDLDADGVPDIAVGAPYDNDGGLNTGAVWILFLSPDGMVKSQQKISFVQGGFTGALSEEDTFGSALASIGDLDADGAVELAVGAPFDDDAEKNRGAVWVLFLNSNGTVRSRVKISTIAGGFVGFLHRSDHFGAAVCALGDLDLDGIADLAVGAPLDDDLGFNSGAVWILLLDADGTVKGNQKISALEGGFTGEIGERDRFGTAVASLGDLDLDGVQDIAVGAVGEIGRQDRGSVWILYLNANGTVKGHAKIASGEGGFTETIKVGDEFGSALAVLPDLDADGVQDLLVGSAGEGGNRGRDLEGAAWLIFLNRDGTAKGQRKMEP